MHPLGEQTKGRFSRTGCSSMAVSRSSSLTKGSNRPRLSTGLSVLRKAARGMRSEAANRPKSWARDQPVSKYWITSGS